MFKVPEWEDSVPNNNANFTKKAPKQKSKSRNTKPPNITQKEIIKQNGIKHKYLKHKKQIKKPKIKLIKGNKGYKNLQSPNRGPETSVKSAPKTIKKSKEALKETINPIETKREVINYNTDNLDEIILDVNKKKLRDQNEDIEQNLFIENTKDNKKEKTVAFNKTLNGKVSKNENFNKKDKIRQCIKSVAKLESDEIGKFVKAPETSQKNHTKESLTKINKKKEIFKAILNKASHRNSVNVNSNLRARMLERLNAAKFRYLNEKLYTSSGSDAQQLFRSDPDSFHTYHQGYQQQLTKWPIKPLDVIVKRIQKMPKTSKIADMGCGTAELAKRVPQPVRSFDLVAAAPGVEACDMARTPLLSCSMDAAVYCLALMGTDLTQYLLEASRVLRIGGHLLIAEVESRFDNVEAFAKEVERLGFSLKKLDKSHQVFFFMEFSKIREAPVKKAKLPMLSLKPCIYKKR